MNMGVIFLTTDINIKVNDFLRGIVLNGITKENIKKNFKDINATNQFGGLLHAAIYYKFSEDKALKFIDTLLQCSIDVNLKGASTGYSFIHLALYGYTKKGKDYSYSTEFIIKLITLAKKYNFDVNIKDNDGDSLIHTALASEIYTGDTAVLIDTLGDKYDLQCKDNNGNNIYEALIKYKKEAEKDKNKIWYDRLSKEEKVIKSYIEKNNEVAKEEVQTPEENLVQEETNNQEIQRIEEVIADEDQLPKTYLEADDTLQTDEPKDSKLNDKSQQENKRDNEETFNYLKTNIEALLPNITIEYLLEDYMTVLNYKNVLPTYLNKQNLNIKEKSSIRLLANKLDLLLKELINNYLNIIIESQDIKNVERLKKILIEFGYEDELQLLNEIISESTKEQEITLNDINECKTLNDLNSLKEKIKMITNEDIKSNLLEELNQKEILFIEQIESIKAKINLINDLKDMNIIKEKKGQEIDSFNELDSANITIDEMNILKTKLAHLIEKTKSTFFKIIDSKIDELLNLVSSGTESGLLSDEEIWEFIDSKLNDKKQGEKVRIHQNANE
mgnify:CR=1 FL=1